MEITKAVITAARRTQRSLPLQTIIDSDGVEKSVLRVLVEEVIDAGVDEICVIVYPGDEAAYAATVGEHAGRLQFVQQAVHRPLADRMARVPQPLPQPRRAAAHP